MVDEDFVVEGELLRKFRVLLKKRLPGFLQHLEIDIRVEQERTNLPQCPFSSLRIYDHSGVDSMPRVFLGHNADTPAIFLLRVCLKEEWLAVNFVDVLHKGTLPSVPILDNHFPI